MSALVRVITPPDPMLAIYARHPYEGMIICLDHLRQIDVDPTVEEVPEALATFMGYRCLMCGVNEAHGRVCQSESCGRPLHPQWPAVYCNNGCAREDM